MPSATPSDQWSIPWVAAALGRSVDALVHLRKRGRFPVPDGHTGRSPWWRPETVAAWRDAQHRPADAVSTRQAVAALLRLPQSRLEDLDMPPADGVHRGRGWWLPKHGEVLSVGRG